MRVVTITIAGLLFLAACQKPDAPKPAASASQSAAEQTGSDEPGAPFSPAPPAPGRRYAALSKTAVSITGDLAITPTLQTGPNMPPGATFTFAKGMALTTTLMPGAATEGTPKYDFKAAFPSLRQVDADKIEMYAVETETPAPTAKAGSVCEKTSFVATYLDDAGTPNADDDTLILAAFVTDDWPPSKPDKALCATLSYGPVTK